MSFGRRLHLLVGVPTALTLLVGAAAVWLSAVFFPPHFQGWGEVTREGAVAGWAVNRAAPSERVEVQLYVDGRFVAGRTADQPRPDVAAAGHARDERCGYSFKLPPLAPGPHEARVYAAHAVGAGSYLTLQLTGRPLRFNVDANGRVSAAPAAE
jgi:hypothetical protein